MSNIEWGRVRFSTQVQGKTLQEIETKAQEQVSQFFGDLQGFSYELDITPWLQADLRGQITDYSYQAAVEVRI